MVYTHVGQLRDGKQTRVAGFQSSAGPEGHAEVWRGAFGSTCWRGWIQVVVYGDISRSSILGCKHIDMKSIHVNPWLPGSHGGHWAHWPRDHATASVREPSWYLFFWMSWESLGAEKIALQTVVCFSEIYATTQKNKLWDRITPHVSKFPKMLILSLIQIVQNTFFNHRNKTGMGKGEVKDIVGTWLLLLLWWLLFFLWFSQNGAGGACIHTYILVHTYIHTYMHSYIPSYLHTLLHTYIPTYLPS